MPKKGENIYKISNGIWEGRYLKRSADGSPKYGYVFAETYAEAKNRLLEVQNLNNPYENPEQPPDSFIIVANEWADAKKPQWKQSSRVKYSNMLESYLFPCFAEKSMSDITRDDVALFSSKLLTDGGASGKGLSPKTVTSIISVMKNVFEYASQIKGYSVADIKGITIKQPQKPMRILSVAEQQKLNRYLCDNLNLCNIGVLLCLYTGLRVGEICALKWEDISFEEQYLYVHRTMQRLQTKKDGVNKTEVIISTPKSDCSIRRIPLPDDIFLLLKKFKRKGKAFLLTGLVNTFIEPRTMQNHFKAVLKECGLSDANFHALRHTFATRCVELGFDIKSLSEILGHASVNITLNRYVHPSMELKQKNMNMLSGLFCKK